LKIALEGRIFELNRAKEDENTRSGADAIIETNLEYLKECLDKVESRMAEENDLSAEAD